MKIWQVERRVDLGADLASELTPAAEENSWKMARITSYHLKNVRKMTVNMRKTVEGEQ